MQHLNTMSAHIAAARSERPAPAVGLTGRFIGDEAYGISVDARYPL